MANTTTGHSWINPGDPTGGAYKPSPYGQQVYKALWNQLQKRQRDAYFAYGAAAKNKTTGNTSTSSPPKPDYGNPVPDNIYETSSVGAKVGRDNTLAAIAAQRTALNEQYGFDPNTGTFAENVDVTNPYSRAALLNKAFARNQAQSRMSYANRGSLNSGAYLAAMQSDADAFNQSRKGLEADFASRRADFLSQENSAKNEFDARIGQLKWELAQRRMAEDAPPYSEGDKPQDPAQAPPPMNDFLKGILDSLKPKEPKGKSKGKGGKNKNKGKK